MIFEVEGTTRRCICTVSTRDGGADVDLVVGLSPPTELLTFSFSHLGVAEMLGKHVVRIRSVDPWVTVAPKAASAARPTGRSAA